ncbi:MAG: cell wall hydrolase [Pseudomonadota bacterium]
MSRKTYSLSAAAIVAVASLSFSSADMAGAVAQESEADLVSIPESVEADETVFVSQEVVQPLPEVSEEDVIEAETPQASSLRELVDLVDTDAALSEQMQCLAGAVYFESRGEPLAGQLAVAQVVINRADDRRFPASYCGVVYQRAQFSFVKSGRMPRIRTGTKAWDRAKAIARIAHEQMWDSEADDSLYFHANYVRPSWSRKKTQRASIKTHIFYR